jgi:hypothetical protein
LHFSQITTFSFKINGLPNQYLIARNIPSTQYQFL